MALGALAALAQYESATSSDECESESELTHFDSLQDFIKEALLAKVIKESVRRCEYAKSINYRNHEAIDIDETSESDDESNDSSSDTDSEDDFLHVNSKDPSQQANIKKKPPPRVKGELLPSDLPPIEDLHITVPEYECIKIGVISSIVNEMVVVQADAQTAALDLETVLFLDKGQRPLGRVFDVMGPVVQPYYCVRFNSKDHVLQKNISVGLPVFFAPRTEHTSFVFLAELMKLKGSDASWENDNEPPAVHLDYSDDEQESKAKRSYHPPSDQARSNNAFYRRDRRYNPRNYGPIQWNSVHTKHMK